MVDDSRPIEHAENQIQLRISLGLVACKTSIVLTVTDEGFVGNSGPHAPNGLYAAAATCSSPVPASLRMEPGEPMGAALE